MTTTCLITLLIAAPTVQTKNLRSLFDVIREVETGGHRNPAHAQGDNGRSLGPYQISRAYWKDSGVPGRYQMVRNKAYAERTMKAYWKRYCPRGLSRLDFQTLARVHNGGPKGARSSRTMSYWRRVQRKLIK